MILSVESKLFDLRSEIVALPWTIISVNFVNISRQMKKFFIQTLDSDRSAFMAAIRYSGPISAVPEK